MKKSKRKALEAAGHQVFDDAADAFGLSEIEKLALDLRAGLGAEIRARREAVSMSQSELATRMGTDQSRISRLERGSPNVSLDIYIRALGALGVSRRTATRVVTAAMRAA